MVFPVPQDIQQRLITHSNLSVNVTNSNSNLEPADSLLQQDAVVQCYGVREHTTKDATNNIATMYWTRKRSTTTTGPALLPFTNDITATSTSRTTSKAIGAPWTMTLCASTV